LNVQLQLYSLLLSAGYSKWPASAWIYFLTRVTREHVTLQSNGM